MSKRTVLRLLCAVGTVGTLLALYLTFGMVDLWVGYTELMVEFVITDARTGAPIPGAELAVIDCRTSDQIVLRTDENGTARRQSPGCMTHGRSARPTPSRESFAVYLPLWQVTVIVPGYRTIDERHIGEMCDLRTVERSGPGHSRIVVPIALEPLP